MRKIVAVDLFCGGGGTSTGMMQACAAIGIDPANIDLTAVNHCQIAVDTHAANHPLARNICSRIEQLQPERLVPGRPDLLWASPECIHHSVARGGKPRSDQSRSQAWTVLDWVQRLAPKAVLIENVPEFAQWGPLVASGERAGQIIRGRVGDTFRAFVAALESLGYGVGWRVMNCADFGDATTRRRLFLMARRGRGRIAWPTATHSQTGGSGLFPAQPWVPARDIIDWSIPGHSIFLTREDVRASGLRIQRPLAKNTMRRIAAGIARYWGEAAEPFLSTLNNWPSQQAGRTIGLPLPAQTTANHFGVVVPFIIGQHSGSAPRAVESPLMTVCTESRGIAICQPFIVGAGGAEFASKPWSVMHPYKTIVTQERRALVRPFIVKYYGTGAAVDTDSPLDSVTTDDRFGLVRPTVVEHHGDRYLFDVLFRMLTPSELAAAHSFPADYRWCGTKSEIVRQIGNSVPVRTAAALCGSAMVA